VPELSKRPTRRTGGTEPTSRGKALAGIVFLELAASRALKDRQPSHRLLSVLRIAAKFDFTPASAWLISRLG
jgi:hypothetical protein